MGIEETYQNIINAIWGKPTTNLIFSDEKLKAFPINLVNRPGCPLSSLSYNMVLEVIATVRNKKKK